MTNPTTPANAPATKAPAKSPAQSVFVTKDLAKHFNTTPKSVRRALRASGVRCGSGARHSWSKKDFNSMVKKIGPRFTKSTKTS